jgi:hypothetical protein
MADYFKEQSKNSSSKLQDTENNPAAVKEGASKSPDQESGVSFAGLNCGSIAEPLSNFVSTACDKLSKKGASVIALGRDSPYGAHSGYGSQGATGASSVHLIAGTGTNNPEDFADRNVNTDAATIYMSQLTDIDENFGLAEGNVGAVEGKSAIGLRADGVRINARHGIKLITEGYGATDSKKNRQQSTVGIDLIAGNNDEDLQPLVKGDDLKDALNEIIKTINDLSSIVDKIQNEIISIKTPIPGSPTTPSVTLMATSMLSNVKLLAQGIVPMYSHQINNETYKINTLEPIGAKRFTSSYNKTN